MEDVKQVIVVRKDLNMRKGKLAAQVSHSSMMSITNQMFKFGNYRILHLKPNISLSIWLNGLFTKIVVGVDSYNELINLIMKAEDIGIKVFRCVDAGKTEFSGVPTLTCAAFGPDFSSKLDMITGHLKLL